MNKQSDKLAWWFICAAWALLLGDLAWVVAFEPRSSRPPATIQHDGQTLYRVDYPAVHDADTITDGVICLPFHAGIVGRSIRADFDAWEVTRGRQTVKVTDEELAKGKAARDALIEQLKTRTLYLGELPKSLDIDPYDRIDAVWYFRDNQGRVGRVADWAKQNGHLRGGK